VLVLSLLALASGCGQADPVAASTSSAARDDRRAGKSGGASQTEEAVPVEVATLVTGPIESVLRFSTNLEAENQVQVFSQAKRLVRELLVEEGDRVRKGQLLLRLQDEEQRNHLAKVGSQLEKAEREYQRQKRLREQELISPQQFADAIFELEQLQIELANAERELSYTGVGAPIAGTVTQRLVNVGDQVQIGQHLFDIVDFDSLVARIFVPEKHLGELRPQLTARVSAAALGERSYVGSVERIAPVVDPQTGTVKVTVAIGGQPGLRPGLYVDVDLVTAVHESALLVPKRALVYDGDQMLVFRLRPDRRVERVFIEALLADKDHLEPASGLQPGDRVVVAGQAGLKQDALVELGADELQPADGGLAAPMAKASS
jgi:membrane fusion protein (multidrug efflux system)